MPTPGVRPGVVYYSIRPQDCTSTAAAFLKKPGQTTKDMEQWISQWCNNILTFANLLSESKHLFPVNDASARNAFFREHYIRITFKSSQSVGNGKWAIDAFYAGKRVDGMPKQNPYYKRDMSVDYFIDVLFEDEEKNVLGGLVWCDLDNNLVSQTQQFSSIARQLRLNADQLMDIMDRQADPRKTVMATQVPRIRLDSGEMGFYYEGMWIPADPTKESSPAMAFSQPSS